MDETKTPGARQITGVLALRRPIKINGKEVTELAYDAYEISAGMFAQADAIKSQSGGKAGMSSKVVAETDYGFQTYLGFMSIIAVNPDYDLKDLERIKGPDLMEIMRIGRNFTLTKSGEASDPSDFDEPSGTTGELTTPQTESSIKED